MPLFFITGNQNKLAEIQAILPGVEQLDVDLIEIQETNPEAIIQEKLQEALKHHTGPLMVEDTGLYLEGMNGLPGPLIKWFIKKIGVAGLAQLAMQLPSQQAVAETHIGYASKSGEIHFFKGSIKGKIVLPQSESNFGWDPIFQPDGYDISFAEMSPAEKNQISMRRQAVEQLKEFLATQEK